MVRTIRRGMLVLTTYLLMGMVSVAAQDGPAVALPQMAEQHAAAAQQYEQKAAAARQEVMEHQAMLDAAYRAEVHWVQAEELSGAEDQQRGSGGS